MMPIPIKKAAPNSATMAQLGDDSVDLVKMLSITWAWTSTPGIVGSIGVVFKSSSPAAEVPIKTSRRDTRSAVMRPSITSMADT